MLGTFALSAGYYDAYYLKAQKVRTLIRRDFERAFEHCDLIVTPTAPTTAFKIGEKTVRPAADVSVGHLHDFGQSGGAARDGDPVRLRRPRNLPIGLQIIGAPFGEEAIFARRRRLRTLGRVHGAANR